MLETTRRSSSSRAGDCATVCQTGGEVEVAEMKEFLEAAARK